MDTTTRFRTVARLVVATLAASAGLGLAAPGAGAAPVLTVTPATGLVDGQIVQAAVSGGEPRAYVDLIQCAPGGSCDERTSRQVRVLPDGTVEGPKKLTVRLRTGAGTADCRRAPAADPCTLAVRVNGGDVLATAPLAFDPRAGLEPPATLGAAPARDLADGQVVHVHGEGYDVGIGVTVLQCRTGSPDTAGCLASGGRPPRTSDTGVLDRDVTVYATFTSIGYRQVDCRRRGACELVVFYTRWDAPPARASVALARGATAPAPPTASISPTFVLTDRQAVHLHGSGFPAGWIDLAMCGTSTCPTLGDHLSAAADGTVDADIVVPAVVARDGTDCRAWPGRCALVLRAQGERYPSARVPLWFDRRAPLAPGPEIGVDPTSDLTTGQIVTVTARRLWPGSFVVFHQCLSGEDPNVAGARCTYLPTDIVTDRAGDLTSAFTADPVVTAEDGTSADCRTAPGGCAVVASVSGAPVASVPVGYAP